MKKLTLWEETQNEQKRPATAISPADELPDFSGEKVQHAPPEVPTNEDLREMSVMDTTLTPIGMTNLIKYIEKQLPGMVYWGVSNYPDGRSDHPPGRYLKFCRESKMKGGGK